MAVETIPEVERIYGSQLASVPTIAGNTIRDANVHEIDPARNSRDAEAYASLWANMTINLALEILDTGTWDEVEVTPVQRQVAYDYMLTHPPKHKQAEIEEC